jgi:hypothetical protein
MTMAMCIAACEAAGRQAYFCDNSSPVIFSYFHTMELQLVGWKTAASKSSYVYILIASEVALD